MSYHFAKSNALTRLLLPLCLSMALGLAMWLAMGWGMAGAGAPSSIPPFQGPCDVVVTNDHDDGGGSLRQAITDVCPGGRITFAADYTIYLTSTLSITRELAVDGEAHTVTVSGDSGDDGTPNVRVFSIASSGVVTLTHLSVVSGTSDMGGGIRNQGVLTVQASTLAGNSAIYYGGGIVNFGTLTVQTSTLADNSALVPSGLGGGIANWGTLTVQASTLVSNSAGWSGGGINNNQGVLTVQASTLAGNSATYEGGGIINHGTLTVQASTLAGNSAGRDGGGINNYAGTMALTNTLIAGSLSGGDCRNGGSGSVSAKDHNLVQSSGDACGLTDGANGNRIGVDPRLGPLANYGGSTLTFALLPGSPAIDAGAACLATDQRGIARAPYAPCDIGAFESRGFNLTLTGGDNQSTLLNTAFAQPLSVAVSSGYGEPVGPGVVITFTAPSAGASLAPPVLTAATDISGTAGVMVTANSLAGSYAVTATTTGVATPVTFTLTNTPPVPAMAVVGNGQVIPDGDPTPSVADSTDFGNVTVGQAVTHTFIISNGGTGDLALTGSPVASISGPAALDFSLVASPALTVAPGATTTFQVRFMPSMPSVGGMRVATVTVANNDPVNNPYDFAIQGSTTQHTFLPVILKSAR